MTIQKPYLLFIGDASEQAAAKMAHGIAFWTPENVIGKISYPECKALIDVPEMSIGEAAKKGAKTLVIGLVNSGGFIPENWLKTLVEAMEAGMDIASGMHTRLAEFPILKQTAEKTGVKLLDVRIPQQDYPVGNGKKRTGKRLLTVGTDCSAGKMFTALALTAELQKQGKKATFRATGQTGIMIAGEGVPVDAVVADFIAGSIEILTPNNDPDHWDLIEGQGSLFHPAYAGVSLGLLHGAQADTLVMCHVPTRTGMRGASHYPLPDLKSCLELNLQTAKLTNPNVKCIGFAFNTSQMPENEARSYMDKVEKEFGLPCVDPVREGVKRLVEKMN